jgi:ParB family transcriptional regulator, chromosome partitioning protein
MTFSLMQIKIAEVDFTDLSFVVSFGFELAPLTASVQELGLLSRPLLRRRQDGQFQIVCGYQRTLVLAQLGWREVPARLVPADKPDVWCLLASLHDNISSRNYNPMEAGLMIARLWHYLPEDAVRTKYLPLLGLPPSRQQFQRLLALNTLEKPWQELVARSRLSPEAGEVLSQWTPPDRSAILPWFQSLHLSFSKQLEFLGYLTTLSRRAGNSPKDWLERPELLDLLADQARSKSEKGEWVWKKLRTWCFPRSSQIQQQFQHYLKALKLYQHPEMRLIPPPAFEDASYRLELRFQDRNQLARQLQQVQHILDQPEFEALLDL